MCHDIIFGEAGSFALCTCLQGFVKAMQADFSLVLLFGKGLFTRSPLPLAR